LVSGAPLNAHNGHKALIKHATTAAIFLVALALLGASVATGKPSSTDTQSDEAVSSVQGVVVINFTGAAAARQSVREPFAISVGSNAWAALQQAVGVRNVGYVDYGGSLGIMVTSLYGTQAQGNHFWEFVINGESASLGVSAYVVKEDDRLEFRYSSY
jgi:hypothetical protein